MQKRLKKMDNEMQRDWTLHDRARVLDYNKSANGWHVNCGVLGRAQNYVTKVRMGPLII